ncbi:MAG: hypothetical protein H0T42_12655 [Deltaproteobacteria bacterium]|nr:hypothetical protein [Deltaproteobacteria bacterium]
MTMNCKSIVICAGLLVANTAAAEEADLRPPGTVMPTIAVRAPRARFPSDDVPLWGGGARLTGLSGIGALPGVNMGVELAVFVRRDERFLELGLGRWVPQETYVVAQAPERVELGLDVWTLRGGWASRTMPLRAWLLVETGELAGRREMTGMIARMVGAVEEDRRWLAAGGGFGVAWPMADRARLFGTVEVAIPIERTPMAMMEGRDFEPAAAAVRANLGLELGWR